MEERFIVQTSTPERKFVKVYLDFLNAGLLSGKEQIIFIHLKQYINFANDTGTVRGEVYPTLATLAKNVKMSEKTIRTVLQGLQKKGILEIKQQGMNKPNIYKINDSARMWKVGNVEELRAAVDEIEEKRMIDLLIAKGYYISKEKGLETEPTKAQNQAPQKKHDVYNKQDTTSKIESQDLERYTLDQIHELFDYDIMVLDYPLQQNNIDSIMSILYTAMNTTKSTIRIAGEDKPAMAVIGKLMKLHKESIMYAIKQFSEQTERIKNPTVYMLTILYNAPEQFNLDIQNRVSHDMASWNRLDE